MYTFHPQFVSIMGIKPHLVYQELLNLDNKPLLTPYSLFHVKLIQLFIKFHIYIFTLLVVPSVDVFLDINFTCILGTLHNQINNLGIWSSPCYFIVFLISQGKKVRCFNTHVPQRTQRMHVLGSFCGKLWGHSSGSQ